MLFSLKLLLNNLTALLKSEYRWLLIFFIIWIYRVDFIPADGGGLAKGLQVGTTLGMLYYIMKYQSDIFSYTYNKTNNAIKWCLTLYLYATFSALWAYMPTFAGFLGFQNVVLILLLTWMFSEIENFYHQEMAFLMIMLFLFLFEAILYRLLVLPNLFIHYLPAGSTSALCISYCTGELLAARKMSAQRKKILRGCIIVALIVLVTSTSSGANASAVFGIAIASLLSGKIIYGLILAVIAGALYYNKDMLEQLISFIMPGKTKETIESATGRTFLWDIIYELAAKRPLFGWGFGCIERAATDTGKIQSPDAHNNYIGLYGSLGYVGSAIAYLHMVITTISAYGKRIRPGYTGLISAYACALLNGYSFGFLSGKACSITVVYFSIVVLTFCYSFHDEQEDK